MLGFNNYTEYNYIKAHLLDGEFGLEKESLRVNQYGTIADTPHPFGDMESITRDFSEAQLEFVTSIHNSVDDVIGELKNLHSFAYKRLGKLSSGKELIWCFSNPPFIDDENSVDVAQFPAEKNDKVIYRKYLAEKYGKRKMLLSGIHFNFSFPKKLVKALFECSGEKELRVFKDNLYLEAAARLIEYSWLIVILTASSPVCDSSFVGGEKGKTYCGDFATIRCGANGYWNNFSPFLDYSSIKSYTSNISDYIEQGLLKAESELYCPVRLKPKGENSLKALLETGVNHIEFRLLDVNPLYEAGINPDDLRFIHLFLVYLLSLDKTDFSRQKQKLSYEMIKKSAGYDISDFKDMGIDILNDVKCYFDGNLPDDYSKALDLQIEKLTDNNKLYSHIIREKYKSDYIGKCLQTAEYYAKN